jgi:putative oxidoreductase
MVLPPRYWSVNSLIKRIDALYGLFRKAADSLQSPFLLAVRLYWGWQFLQTGWGKLTHMSKAVDFFTSLGIPAPALTAHFIAVLETTGGILLILGLASRLIALPLVINMIVAYIAGDREGLTSIFSDPDKFTKADPFPFLFASLVVLAFGPGWFSLDTLIKRYRSRRQPQVATAR